MYIYMSIYTHIYMYMYTYIYIHNDDDCFYIFKSILVPLVEGLCSSEFSVLHSHRLLCFFGRKNILQQKYN